MIARYTVVLNGTRQEIREKANILAESISNMDDDGEDRMVSRDWCPKCETPYHFVGMNRPDKCDICGAKIPREVF